MSQRFFVICLSVILSRKILVQSIQEENSKNFESIVFENEVRLFENITSKNTTSKWQQQEYLSDHQAFVNSLLTKLKLAINSMKVDATDDEENGDHLATQLSFSRGWTRKLRQIAIEDVVDTDETIAMTFNEKERRDGFTKTHAQANPYAVLVSVAIHNQVVPYICSGTLVTSKAVLTAAHCFDHEVVESSVFAGVNSLLDLNNMLDAQLRKTDRYYQHPKYTKETPMEFDLAVVEVKKAFKTTSDVKPLKVGKRPWTHDRYKACKLTAFGKVYYEKDDYDDNARKTHYLEVKRPCPCLWREADGKLMCSKPRENYGLCSGDSGGGLVCDGVLVAVAISNAEFISIGNCSFKEKKDLRCGTNNSISVFLETGPYLDWINGKINRASSYRSRFQVLVLFLMTTLYYIK